jgi:CNT family concentrative nucleoside transporter
MDYLRALGGVAFIIGIAYALSGNRRAVDWRLVGFGILLQIAFALLTGKVEATQQAFQYVSSKVVTFLGFAQDGAEFLYGDLARDSTRDPAVKHNLGFLFAFQALPTVIFFSAITAGLYYLGVLQKIVFAFAWIMARTMRLSGSESLSAAANIFMGQTEAPLLVRPFIARMTQSELHCLMTGGMATIAGSVLGAYVAFLGGDSHEERAMFASYLIGASIINAPAAILISKIKSTEGCRSARKRLA